LALSKISMPHGTLNSTHGGTLVSNNELVQTRIELLFILFILELNINFC
jgi:hypothetical protein